MHLSIEQVTTWNEALLLILWLFRGCSCADDECDVCGRRCLITMNDGCDVRAPVVASDGQLYDLFALRTWARKQTGGIHVVPGTQIVSVSSCRVPLADAWRRATAACVWCAYHLMLLVRCAVQRVGHAIYHLRAHVDDGDFGTSTNDERAHPLAVTPLAVTPRHSHPYPRTLVSHAPCSIYRLSVVQRCDTESCSSATPCTALCTAS